MIYIKLFLEFFKIGLFSIGGGLATLPFLQQLVQKYGWITQGDLLDMIAISESTPGPIGINTATFVGYKTGGVLGGLIATLGIVTPSVIIILIIAHYFMKFSEQPVVRSAFYGLRPAVIGLIAAAGFEVAKVSLVDIKAIALFGAIYFLLHKYKKHPILYLVGAAIVGILLRY